MIESGEDRAALAAVEKGDADLALVGAAAAIRSLAAGDKLRIVYESAPGGHDPGPVRNLHHHR